MYTVPYDGTALAKLRCTLKLRSCLSSLNAAEISKNSFDSAIRRNWPAGY